MSGILGPRPVLWVVSIVVGVALVRLLIELLGVDSTLAAVGGLLFAYEVTTPPPAAPGHSEEGEKDAE